MAETLPQTKEEMGLVDTLNGIIATVSKRLFEEFGEIKGFTEGQFIDGVHALKVHTSFKDSHLKYLDFRRTGDSYYSSALEGQIFIGGVWGAYDRCDWGKICLYPERYKKRLEKFKEKFGEEKVSLLEQMAEEFIRYHRSRVA